jgi:hypothetical protein
MSLALLACVLSCIPKLPRQRLENATPIVVGYVVDPTYAGAPASAPEAFKSAMAQALEERNLTVVEVPFPVFEGQRITDARTAALKAYQPEAPYHLLIELRVHFFSQLDGRYRWEVGTALTASKTGGILTKDAFEVPVVLVYDHEKQRAAMNMAASDIAIRVGTLIDGLLASGAASPATGSETIVPGSFQQPLTPGQLVPTKAKPKESGKETSKDSSVREVTPKDAGALWAPRAIYFAMVDRFANADTSNDMDVDRRDPNAFHGGDLKGVLQNLDWIQQMGFDTVWISPVFAMRTEKWHGYGAFHGYWTWDLNAIEPRFGTEADLIALSDSLHQRGMKLFLDLVLNHLGPDAPLVRAQPEWFHRKGAITDWSDPSQLVSHDVHGLPDFATERPDVRSYLVETSRGWLQPRPS